MNPDSTAEMSLDESIATLLSGLPGPVQTFVLGPDRPRIALELSKKYSLHVDQAGAFETAYIHMLLGISSPEEFVDTLTKAGIASESVRGLAQDVNEQVFVPLRKAEQEDTPAAVRSAPAPQAILPGSNEPVPVVAPKPIAVTPAPTVPLPQMEAPQSPPAPVYGYIPQQMPPQMMYAPPYAVPHGYGAPVYMWPQQAAGPGWPQAPTQAQQFQQPPATIPAPVEMPVVQVTPANQVAQSSERIPAPAPQTQPKATLNPGAHIEKNYSADPYREPFTA